ncbi:MAG: AI-2E family transporter [Polyangiaceae bacterium]
MAKGAQQDDSSIPKDEMASGERRALGWTAIAAAAAIVWIVMPIGLGVLLGTLLAFTLQPVFERLLPKLGPRWSALFTVVVSTAALAGSLVGLAWLLLAKGAALAREWIASLGPNGQLGAVLSAVGRVTAKVGISPDELASRSRALAETAATRAAAFAEALLSTTASSLLALFFAMMSMHFILRNWNAITRRAAESLPLRPDYTSALLAEFRRVGRATLLGTVGTGIAQGVLATIGYMIAGVPEPLFFGAATAVASLIPAVGTLLVWVPVGVALILGGHLSRGILELAWGALVVAGISDYVIRPMLVDGGGEMPTLVTFAALLGGVEVLGPQGLIVGPVVMSIAIAVLRLYFREARKMRT